MSEEQATLAPLDPVPELVALQYLARTEIAAAVATLSILRSQLALCVALEYEFIHFAGQMR